MPLRLKLKPGERVILGGAVVRNGSSSTELFVENDTPVLREPDVLRPGSVRTPCERIYLALQLLYVDSEQPGRYTAAYRLLADEVLAAAPSCAPLLTSIDEHLKQGKLYRALREARRLIGHERRLVSHVS
jgi:flagellar protein FlbT